jgi:PAS domain-containing protein
MDLGALSARIEVFSRRLAELQELGPIGVEPAELLERLSACMEELQSAHEQLRDDSARFAEIHTELDTARAENAQLWDASPFAQVLTGADLLVVRVNGAAAALVDAPAEKLVARPLPLLVAREDRERFREAAFVMRGGRTGQRSWEVALDGPRGRLVTAWASPFGSAFVGRDMLLWTFQDVTDHRSVEDALQKACRALEAQLVASDARENLLEVRRRGGNVAG